MSDLIPLEDLAQEANDSHEQVLKNTKQAISAAWSAGQALLMAKSQTQHGEWMAWQKLNLNYSQQTASRYMTIASNYSSMSNLKDAKDISDALRMISERKAEENPEHVPRAERKTGRVKVTESTPPESSDSLPERDPDPNPAPRTNTLHNPETVKAKEADRPVPAAVTPEIVEEFVEMTKSPWIKVEEALCVVAEESPLLESKEKKDLAKKLRKRADELDPPDSNKTPSKSQLIAMIPDDWAPDLQRAAADWAEYRQSRAKGERIQTTRAWELALEQFTSQPSKEVISKVNKAIEKSWKGWDHDSKTGNGSSTGRVTTGRIKPTTEEPKITFV